MPCQDTLDCARMNLGGYTCQNLRCVCDPTTDTGLFPCRGRMFGDKCRTDHECAEELHLVCSRNGMRTCRCRRGYMWNTMNRICYMIDEHPFDNGNKYDHMRDIFVYGFVFLATGAFVYIGFRTYCNWHLSSSGSYPLDLCGLGDSTCSNDTNNLFLRITGNRTLPHHGKVEIPPSGNLWQQQQRRRTRGLDEISDQQDTWVASYRVISSLNGMETHSSPVLSPSSSFSLRPTPCMGLFLPSSSLAAAAAASTTASTTSPPPYDEALKHKIILSSLPSATTVVLPPAPPIQGLPSNMQGGNSQGGLN